MRVGSVINYILCMLLETHKHVSQSDSNGIYTNFNFLLVGMHGGLFVSSRLERPEDLTHCAEFQVGGLKPVEMLAWSGH